MATGVQVWSPTPVTNATADSNVNFAEGQAPSSVNDSCRAAMASVAKWRDDNNTTLITSGSTAALTLVTNQVEAALTAGYTVAVTLGTAVDAAATLAVDGLTAKPIQIVSGTNISAGQLSSGATIQLVYSTTGTGQWVLKDTPPILVSGAPNANTGASITITPPPAFNSTTQVMMGRGGVAKFVPATTGRCWLSYSLMTSNSGTNIIRSQLFYGTGTAPTSGAATAGTSAGAQNFNNSSAGGNVVLRPTVIITGLTIGTTYWVDLGLSVGAGTLTSTTSQFDYIEF